MAKKCQGLRDTSESFLLSCNCSFCDGVIRYFGRAKDLPGVRELFQSRKKEEEEENQALAYYKKFMKQGPGYFGDLDENSGKLLEFEREAEQEGKLLYHLLRDFDLAHVFVKNGKNSIQTSGKHLVFHLTIW